MHVTIDTTISDLIDKICATPAGKEEPLLQILDRFIAELDKLPKEQCQEIWQAIMDLRLADTKVIDICKKEDLLEPQMPKCRLCKAGLLYIAYQELEKARKQLDTAAESI